MAKETRKYWQMRQDQGPTRQNHDLQNLLAELRNKAKNNAESGSRDERDAWAGMASELNRALKLSSAA